jgi:hypothetical protein
MRTTSRRCTRFYREDAVFEYPLSANGERLSRALQGLSALKPREARHLEMLRALLVAEAA